MLPGFNVPIRQNNPCLPINPMPLLAGEPISISFLDEEVYEPTCFFIAYHNRETKRSIRRNASCNFSEAVA